MSLDKIINEILNGKDLSINSILPFLCNEKKEERSKNNYALADAFYKTGLIDKASIFVKRALIQSDFSEDILPIYINIFSSLGDIEMIRFAYKRIGINQMNKGNIANAIKYFNLWQYAYATNINLDKYYYDFDILDVIEKVALSHSRVIIDKNKESIVRGKRIKVAYLVFGISHNNSVIVKIISLLGRYHNKKKFDISFFIPDSFTNVDGNIYSRRNIKKLKKTNCKIHLLNTIDDYKRIVELIERIIQFKPDVLITSAVLADFWHYYIAASKPAPIIIGLLQGPPQQFVYPNLDWCISWSKHPLIDSPCNGSIVNLGLELPIISNIKKYRKRKFGIPDNFIVLMSAGRHFKFQDYNYWKAITEVLKRNNNAFYIVAGVNIDQIKFLNDLLSDELKKRILLLGWRNDVINIYSMVDIFIDSYPSGGGHTLIDAMSLGIPFVSFENDYFKEYDQTNWSVVDEFCSIPELVVERGNFEKFKHIINRLIDEKEYRIQMGTMCKEHIDNNMGGAEIKIKEYEKIITNLIAHRSVIEY